MHDFIIEIKVFSASHFAAEEKSSGADGGPSWCCWSLATAATEHKQRVKAIPLILKARIQD